jgi:hypothetical protein
MGSIELDWVGKNISLVKVDVIHTPDEKAYDQLYIVYKKTKLQANVHPNPIIFH